ncbi:hypothetical protein F511_32528 [Dorcoceras hygrometricum]|uniref:Uncharacterized protein n=1 Tax=Dorcoceras hygrometricum TaxID=472368 RepID=A0A2Z7C509_9LAMI|nr:hypothetical protein F511_32528 [Dorcoceras hygrometricum]
MTHDTLESVNYEDQNGSKLNITESMVASTARQRPDHENTERLRIDMFKMVNIRNGIITDHALVFTNFSGHAYWKSYKSNSSMGPERVNVENQDPDQMVLILLDMIKITV